MFDLIIPTCCIEERADEKEWGLGKRRNEWRRARSQGRGQEAKPKGRDWQYSGEETEGDKKEHVLEMAWYELDLPIVKLQMKEMKVA